MKYKMFIAIRPDGTPCGPCMENEVAVEYALDIGQSRTPGMFLRWDKIGYRIVPCTVEYDEQTVKE
jgi:hypothetical protein